MIEKVVCSLFGHKYDLNMDISPRETKVVNCVRCKYPAFWCCNHYNPETKEGGMEYRFYK